MDGRPARLVIVITGLRTGGAEMMLLKVLERLDPAWRPHVISLTDVGEIGQRIAALGIPVEGLGLRPGRVGPLAVARLASRLRELQPDVVHTWMYHADLVGGLAARLAGGCAVGWCIRNNALDPARTRRSTRLVARACALLSGRVPDRIVSCSEVARQVHVDLGYCAERMVVVPNGFDLAAFRPDAGARADVRRELGVAADTPLVGIVGRVDPQKNYDGFFAAAGLLHAQRPAVRFVLAGQGLERGNAAMVALAAKAGVGDVTHLLGRRDDIPRLMAAFDVYVSSSHSEAFPNVLGEAMACGVPCAVTDAGDSGLIVGDTGRVVAPGDMNALAAAIGELLDLPPLQRAELAESARARVAAHFEIGAVVKAYEAFYAGLAALALQRKAAD
jgi:glycosyltransferase involved in cell wall biosynthesis